MLGLKKEEFRYICTFKKIHVLVNVHVVSSINNWQTEE